MFYNHINNFRGFAILLIVAGHSIDFFNWGNSPIVYNFLQAFFKNGTVFFVFISGFLFQHLSAKYEYKNFLIKKFKNVILPYLIIYIPALIYYFFAFSDEKHLQSFFEEPLLFQIFQLYISGDALGPLWFIPMIFIFFIISPILLNIDNKNLYKYIIPISLIISLFIPRDHSNPIIQNFVHFFSIYIIGMCVSRFHENVIKFAVKFFPQICFFSILLTTFLAFDYNIQSSINYLSKLIGCFAILGLFYKLDNKINKCFSLLATLSFGIFFVHGYFLVFFKILTSKFLHIYLTGNIIYVILYTIFILFITIGSIVLAKKILGQYSKNIIGC